MRKSQTQYTPCSVQREQEVTWDGWGNLDYPTPPEDSKLSGANNNSDDSLILELFKEPRQLSDDTLITY